MKVTVLMSAYNEDIQLLRYAVESIENQTFDDYEYIIILDNPKNDELWCELVTMAEKYKNIILIKNERNIGLAESLNKGIALSKGEYIARMDADDYSYPDRLKKEVEYLDKHGDISVVSTNRIVIDENGTIVSGVTKLPKTRSELCRQMEYENVILHPSVMFRKDIIQKIGMYRNYPASQDADLWLRLLDANYNIGFIDEPLMKYRVNSKSITVGSPLKQWICGKHIQRMHKERKNSGTDSYCEDQLLKYLEDNGVYDKRCAEKFKKGKDAFFSFRKLLKQKKILNCVPCFFQAFFSHKEMPSVIFRTFAYQVIIRIGR